MSLADRLRNHYPHRTEPFDYAFDEFTAEYSIRGLSIRDCDLIWDAPQLLDLLAEAVEELQEAKRAVDNFAAEAGVAMRVKSNVLARVGELIGDQHD